MTHDELKALIAKAYNAELGAKLEAALLAVVELHKPYGAFIDLVGVVRVECHYCHFDYPCRTIKAIEKELG